MAQVAALVEASAREAEAKRASIQDPMEGQVAAGVVAGTSTLQLRHSWRCSPRRS